MDGILLANGTFIERTTTYHIDMIKKIFPDCKSEIEAIMKHKCILIVEYKNGLVGGIREMQNDYIIAHGENKNETTKEQLEFLCNNITKLSINQLNVIPALAAVSGLLMFPKCDDCVHYEDRIHFIQGRANLGAILIQLNYHHGLYKPEQFLDCCKYCKIKDS